MTKNYFIYVFFLLFSVNTAISQDFSFGITAGVNFANLYSSNMPTEEYAKMKAGFHAGPMAQVRFSNLFAIQTELLYSQQGSKMEIPYIEITPPGELGYSNTEPAANQTTIRGAKSKYDYLNLPVLAKFYVYKGLNAFAGPQVSLLLSAKDEYESEEVNVKEEIDAFDFGILGGVGYELKMGLLLKASYYLGLNNISNINYKEALGYDPDLHQGVIQISAGYIF
ncbi:porin family protein [Zunongwangia sp. F363]|uniref:Porin family protein n=1 Tax=Autumnicola tepida TaxID=3075595 RepID=A0ABU3CDI9_9FLAO|nr:porin family protein [Zunongwangia sp. F363]MDT0644307.1 porin family protein [Zunongwangia sp. F363]